MAIRNHIRNPVEAVVDWVLDASRFAGSAAQALRLPEDSLPAPLPVSRIAVADLRDVVAKGLDDFGAYRTDALLLCVIYPVAGLVLAWAAFENNLIPLLFPLASGFTLIGPLASVGLYELSRRREQTAGALAPVRAPAFGGIVLLGLVLVAIFMVWLAVAYVIFLLTLGPEPPASVAAFARDVVATTAGRAMIAVGVGVGFLFAALVLAIGVVSFPLMLDRNVGVHTAIATSVRAVAANPGPMALWGLIVAGSLVIGSLPALLGLVVVMPVLGHATWHLYRKVVPRG